MRDDIALLFDSLIEYQDKKNSLLKQIFDSERDLNSLLDKHIDNNLTDLVDTQNNIISEINIIDFEKTSIINKIKELSGIDPENFKYIKIVNDELSLKLFIERKKFENDIMKKIQNLININIARMENIQSETKKDADELKRIEKLKLLFPKDLRFF